MNSSDSSLVSLERVEYDGEVEIKVNLHPLMTEDMMKLLVDHGKIKMNSIEMVGFGFLIGGVNWVHLFNGDEKFNNVWARLAHGYDIYYGMDSDRFHDTLLELFESMFDYCVEWGLIECVRELARYVKPVWINRFFPEYRIPNIDIIRIALDMGIVEFDPDDEFKSVEYIECLGTSLIRMVVKDEKFRRVNMEDLLYVKKFTNEFDLYDEMTMCARKGVKLVI